MPKSKKFDLMILLIYPIFAVIISHLLKINYFLSTIVFFGLPSLYLTLRVPKFSKRVMVFSLIFIPLAVIVDYIAHFTGQWIIVDSIFPRIFNYVTIESIIWAVLHFYFVLMFYEYFLHHHSTKVLWYFKLKLFFMFNLLIFFFFLFLVFFSPELLHVSYFYLWLTILLILIPILFQLFKYPKFILKFFEIMAYFFYFTLLYEITALQLGWWAFPSDEFIGWISIGNIRFPLEEFISWMILWAMAMLSYYEYFDAEER